MAERTTPLPTRLLDLSEDPNAQVVSLLETGGRAGKYIALSHCWGLSHRLTTTKSTLSAHINGISISALPRTFQDAIQLARRLDVRFVWIDSLCVVQDDAKDWERESAKMGDVYSYAYLTIAAAASTDDSTGCFPERNVYTNSSDPLFFGIPGPSLVPVQVGPGLLAYPSKMPMAYLSDSEGAACSVSQEWLPSSVEGLRRTYYCSGDEGLHVDPVGDQNLSMRAWVLQERLLSHRTLHYAEDQMYWECHKHLQAEDGARFPTSSRSFPGRGELPLGDTYMKDEGQWWALVEDYAVRHLTRGTDKLPAIGGLAKAIARNTGDTYLAGHWRRSLLPKLLWRIRMSQPTHNCANPDHHEEARHAAWKWKGTRFAGYRAPSWSWACHVFSVQFTNSSMIGRELAEILTAEVSPLGNDPFGQVKSGLIKFWVCYVPHDVLRHLRAGSSSGLTL